jgi:hypothetical protein
LAIRGIHRSIADREVGFQIERFGQNGVEHFQRGDLRIDAEFAPLGRLVAFAFLDEDKRKFSHFGDFGKKKIVSFSYKPLL